MKIDKLTLLIILAIIAALVALAYYYYPIYLKKRKATLVINRDYLSSDNRLLLGI